jgi:hypothetical protein
MEPLNGRVVLPAWINDGNVLVPGEHPIWSITDRQVSTMLAWLEDEGTLQDDDEAGWVFEVGVVQTQFKIARPDPGRDTLQHR